MKAMHLGGMTLRSVFTPPETTCYPAEERAIEGRHRGTVLCDIDTCIFCGKCARVCPAGAISVERGAKTWAINRLSCVQCASCVEACPKNCLTMDARRPDVAAERGEVRLTQCAHAE